MTLRFKTEADVLRFVRPKVSAGQVGAVAFAIWKEARRNVNDFREAMIAREEALRIMHSATKVLHSMGA